MNTHVYLRCQDIASASEAHSWDLGEGGGETEGQADTDWWGRKAAGSKGESGNRGAEELQLKIALVLNISLCTPPPSPRNLFSWPVRRWVCCPQVPLSAGSECLSLSCSHIDRLFVGTAGQYSIV